MGRVDSEAPICFETTTNAGEELCAGTNQNMGTNRFRCRMLLRCEPVAQLVRAADS